MNNFETALANAEKGYVSIPCRPGTKVPCVRWTPFQTEPPTSEQYRHWFQWTRNNLAILTTGLVVFDCDDPEKVDLVIKECGDTPCKLQTPNGGKHLHYRARRGVVVGNHVKIKGMGIDIKAENGLAMQPFSVTEDGAYEWLTDGLRPISELPLAKISWTRERIRKAVITPVVPMGIVDPHSLLGRGQLYVSTFERRAISGSNGHTSLFIAACKIVRWVRNNAGGDERLMWDLLLWFNANKADPPWNLEIPAERKALEHKFQQGLKNAR